MDNPKSVVSQTDLDGKHSNPDIDHLDPTSLPTLLGKMNLAEQKLGLEAVTEEEEYEYSPRPKVNDVQTVEKVLDKEETNPIANEIRNVDILPIKPTRHKDLRNLSQPKKSSSYQPPSHLKMNMKINGRGSSLRPKRVSTSTGHQRPTCQTELEIANNLLRSASRKSRTKSIGEEARANMFALAVLNTDESSSSVMSPISITKSDYGTPSSTSSSSSLSQMLFKSPNSKYNNYKFQESDSEDEYSDDDDSGYLKIPVREAEAQWDEKMRAVLSLFSDEVDVFYDSEEEEEESVEMSYENIDSNKGSKEIFDLELENECLAPYLRVPSLSRSVAQVTYDYSDVNLVESNPDCNLSFFNLKVVFRQKHTGFEPTHEFPIRKHDIIAGRYEILKYLGSAAFSRAVKCLDHKTNTMVCAKIIKNNKDYLDQSLDEIKLLKYINDQCKGDCDNYNVLQMYNYFYFKEHLFIISELLQDNLYEVYKKSKRSNDYPYFTVPRLQKIAWQCLVALEYIHSLDLIHCDLKPENVLIKDYENAEIKVIDFGSSCFTSDQLSSYVQSRSYRAPEVLLGHAYDQRIDMWSLGCILAELWTGRVIFQNESLVTLLSKQIGVVGLTPSDREYLKAAPLGDELFSKQGILYDEKNDLYIYPKRTTLKKRLQTEDELFLSFVQSLLTFNPAKRPTSTQAKMHPWFKHVYHS